MSPTLTPAGQTWLLEVPISHPLWLLAAKGKTVALGRVTKLNPATLLAESRTQQSWGLGQREMAGDKELAFTGQ